ncbi:MAG: glycosyltransferase family 4 protein, partial [Bacteroidales bacterium]|nr:glycosyltransferase family 4 protein [Bacteroidales bacterium]
KIISFKFKKKFSLKEINYARKILREGQFDIVHVFYSPAMINILMAARNIKTKIVLYRGYCGHIHWWDPTQYFKYLHPRVNAIWAIAPAVENLIKRNTLITSPYVFTVYKGHHPSWYNNISPYPIKLKYNLPENAFIITMVANARKMKGLRYFIDALAKIPTTFPIYTFLIGKGLKTANIEKKIKSNFLHRKVFFIGHVPNPLIYVASSNCFVLSSIYGEATTKSVLEAMFLKIPCIITDIPGNEPLMENMNQGIKVPPRNPDALAKAILFYYYHPQVAQYFAHHAYEYVNKTFHIDKTVKNLLQKYEELLS